MNKNKLKTFLTKKVPLSIKYIVITLIVFLFAVDISQSIGETDKLNQLVEQEANVQITELKQTDDAVKAEIESLTAKKEELNNTLNSKADIQYEMKEYDTNKAEYTNQISQLNTDIGSLDGSISQKQNELNEKKAAAEKAAAEKAAAEKAAAEKAAAEKAAAEQAAASASVNNSSDNQSHTVYITDTGSKYHSSGCRHLKKSKIAISEDKAIAQGYTRCSQCNP